MEVLSEFRLLQDDIFPTAYMRRKELPDSFGELHAKYAVAALDESTSVGERLFECMQGLC